MSHLKTANVIILSPAMDIHTDVQYSGYLEEIQRITGPLSRYQLDQLKELIYRIESSCVIGRQYISQRAYQQGAYSATEHNEATNSEVYSSNLSITESKNGMSYICNSAIVDKDEYFQEPIIIPRLDLSFLLDDESTEKPSTCWDIPVWSMSERSNNIKSITSIKPEIEKLDLSILSECQEDNDIKEDVSVDIGYSHGKLYGKNKNHSYKKENVIEKTHHETKNGMSYTCSSAVVVKEQLIIPRLDLSCVLDNESTEKPSSSWDIPVWAMRGRSNNSKSINKPIIVPRLDLSCLLDDKSTEKPSSSLDISVWSPSERSNNIKSINKPEIDLLFFQNV